MFDISWERLMGKEDIAIEKITRDRLKSDHSMTTYENSVWIRQNVGL